MKLLKCAFFKRHLQYIGHLILGKAIYPSKEKVAAFVNLASSSDVIETRHIIVLASYYRQLMTNFSDIGRSLTELIMKNTYFNWSPLCQASFDTIKSALAKSPIFVLPDPNQPYVLFKDASKHRWYGVFT